ncbi:AAA family ATPase [Altericista sp. CCNU0014]|uniref:AAA family ATPase n=1 Tax=Altericista sp. CCNU0014 TaxID=3082949 RepID=UPI00384FDFEC
MSSTQTFLRNYEISELIYDGDKTLVYRGERKSDSRKVVIKLLKSTNPTIKELAQFRHQYTVINLLNDSRIIKSYGLERHKNGLALILEDFGGISLKEYLKSQIIRDLTQGKLPSGNNTVKLISLSTFFHIALQLVQSLESLYHSKVIHKDINPENILIHPVTQEIKLTDFSIASRLNSESQSIQRPESLEGTLAYMSPEQTGRMNRSIDHRTDFYSLGITFYELLTGCLPFRSFELLELIHEQIARSPIPPLQLNSTLPQSLNQIILKLLAKVPEERYQTAFGLKKDLEHSQANWLKGINKTFDLGSQDFCDRLVIPEKLYGREKDLETLRSAYERVENGQTEIVMVSGNSGVGKTSFVKEIQRLVIEKKGYFISGKYNQFHNNRPLEAIVNAFKDLIYQLLTESKTQIKVWQKKIIGALGENGQILIEVLPELEFLIGKQPVLNNLEAIQSQNRFNFVFQQFIQIFPQSKHPLVLFLDDLQWADLGSLQLIHSLMSQTTNPYLLIIGAYRQNEVEANHPLTLSISKIRKTTTIVQDIHLTSPPLDAWNNLLFDTFKNPSHLSKPLAQWIYNKTQGNSFFYIQYIKTLYQRQLITFNWEQRVWEWSLSKIQSDSFADSIIELIIQQIQKFSPETQNLLEIASCQGISFSSKLLAHVSGYSQLEVRTYLWDVLQAGLITSTHASYDLDRESLSSTSERSSVHDSGSLDTLQFDSYECIYSFVHDRIHQAAYSLIPIESKNNLHLVIGHFLLGTLSPSTPSEQLCEIVNHLNQGILYIKSTSEKSRLAQLNWLAGCKAQTSTSYIESTNYFHTGIKLLESDGWRTNYELMLELHYGVIESTLLLGDYTQMEYFVNEIIVYSKNKSDTIKGYQVKIEAYKAQAQSQKAVTVGLEILDKFGINFPGQISSGDIQNQFHETQFRLENKDSEDLLNLPVMTEPDSLIIMDLIGRLLPITYSCNPRLFSLLLLKQINLSLEKGNCSISSWNYIAYSVILWTLEKEIDIIYKFGSLGIRLCNKFDNKNDLVISIFTFNTFIFYWKNHLNKTLHPLLNNYVMSLEVGDLVHASFSLVEYVEHSFWCGRSLIFLEEEFSNYHKSLLNLKQEITIRFYEINWHAVSNLIGDTTSDRTYDKDLDNELITLRKFEKTENRQAIFLYHLNKLHFYCLFRDFAKALKYAEFSENYLDAVPCRIVAVSFYFYKLLVLLFIYPEKDSAEQSRILEAVAQLNNKLEKWAESAPMNFLHKYYLVQAEQHRVLGQYIEAMSAYDRAIALAQENEYLNEEALAHELAGLFYLGWGKTTIAQTYLINAYYAYERWGAKAKLRDLERRHPDLLDLFQKSESNLSINTLTTFSEETHLSRRADTLDWLSIMRASQALSQEIDLDTLLAAIMKVVLENAGAEKGSLLLIEEENLVLKARCTQDECHIDRFKLFDAQPQSSQKLSMSVLNYVERTQQALVLANATAETRFAADSYIAQYQPLSILCMPIQRQGTLVGILYLENNLTTDAFTTDRLEVLQFLMAQAAISIENAQLYASVEQKVKDRTLELQIAKQEAERAKEASEKANRAKSEFLANMSHELRTPLNAVLGFSQLLHRDPSTSPEQRAKLDIINRSGEHLLTLINDVLTMSKIESGRTTLHETTFDLQALVSSIHEMLLMKATSKNLKFEVECSQDIPQFIQADDGKLRQVLINLLGNAIKFTQQGSVKLRVSQKYSGKDTTKICPSGQTATSLLFEVEDTGPGIAPHELEDLFEAFAQTEAGRKSQEGTGLGLPISRTFVRLMGGDIRVKSTVGRGSCFSFDIQVCAFEKVSLTSQSLSNITGLAPGQLVYRILVAEDRGENQQVLVQLLEGVGFEVRVASNGEEAIAVWQTHSPHLILMDLQMPVMDGCEATQAIKRQAAQAQQQPPIVIAITANTFEETRLKSMEMGFDDFVHKPFQAEALFETIAKHLGVRYLREANLQTAGLKLETESDALLDAVTSEDFQKISPEWLDRVNLAASELHESKLTELIEQISEEYPEIASTLRNLLKNFRFDRIVNLVQTKSVK